MSKIWGAIFLKKKKRLRQRAQKLRASKNMGGHFSEKQKAPAATCPEAQGFQKYGGHFSEKKKRLRQRSQPLRASKKSGTIFQKCCIQKPAKPASDLSHNGHQKIHLVQKPFRLLFPATISLKSFWTGYFRPFRPGTFTTLHWGYMKNIPSISGNNITMHLG